jgi:tetratricopeptide (TPR) repeat protein
MPIAKCVAFIVLCSPGIRAGDDRSPWTADLKEFHSLRAQGRHQDGARHIAQAAASESDSTGRATLHYWLGVAHHDLGEYDKAERYYKRAASEFSALGGEHEIQARIALSDLASLYNDTGRTELALHTVERVAIGAESGNSELRVKVFNVKASALTVLGRYREAEEQLHQILSLRDSPETAETASILNNMAVLQVRQGREAQALASLERAIAIVSRLAGAEPERPRLLVNRAEVHSRLGNNLAADRDCREAIALIIRMFGEGHPDHAYVLRLHAAVLKALGRKKDAELAKRQSETLAKSLQPQRTVHKLELGGSR